jgi:rhamnose transport system substrate-binding protein/rhamnose transport system permease protein
MISSIGKHGVILAGLIAVEIAIFAYLGPNFLSVENLFECIRLTVEVGVISLAMTPVIISGGIDLSVGSMMGLSAVITGSLWRTCGLPIELAVLVALVGGVLGGLLNAVLIAQLNVSPLIVTLAGYSLFRGIAEGMTGGAISYSNFPASFLFLGQGYIFKIIPSQTLILFTAIIAYWLILHRSVIGRSLFAIGLSPSGARYAALPVNRRLVLIYALSGFSASLAGLIYVAHVGQAKSDVGTGYELIAITAVVLGGTSILGGSGTIGGTVLGLAAISILEDGLRLSALPAELSGITTAILLLLTIAFKRLNLEFTSPAIENGFVPAEPRASASGIEGEQLRNSQLAVLCSTVIIGALIVAGTNWYLIGELRGIVAGTSAARLNKQKRITVAMMPKAKGDSYFASCRKGAEERAKELDVDLIWDGPTAVDPAKQNEFVESWITRRVDAIAVAVGNAASISTVLRKAREHGISVVTWDSDASPDSRDYFINQATPQAIGSTLADTGALLLEQKGELAIITGLLSAENQNLWIRYIKEHLASKYPNVKVSVVRPSDDDRDKAFAETQTLLKVYPRVRVIVVISNPAVPGAAEAVKQSGRHNVKVIGLTLPSLCKSYMEEGIVASDVLWDTRGLGYLTVSVAAALARHEMPEHPASFRSGKLGTLQVTGTDVILGRPLVLTRANINQFDF